MTPKPTPNEDFAEITRLIAEARQRAFQAVNTVLIDLYWRVGQTISRKIAEAEWGDAVVPQLARHLAHTQPGLRGFTSRNLFRMLQFKATLIERTVLSPVKVSPLVSLLLPNALSVFRGCDMVESHVLRTRIGPKSYTKLFAHQKTAKVVRKIRSVRRTVHKSGTLTP